MIIYGPTGEGDAIASHAVRGTGKSQNAIQSNTSQKSNSGFIHKAKDKIQGYFNAISRLKLIFSR